MVINGVADHLHMLIGLNPKQSISGLLQQVKGDSAEWVNRVRLTSSRFQWQSGYGAFAVSKADVPCLGAYIENQKEHHRSLSLQTEYNRLLEENNIEFDQQYIFKELA